MSLLLGDDRDTTFPIEPADLDNLAWVFGLFGLETVNERIFCYEHSFVWKWIETYSNSTRIRTHSILRIQQDWQHHWHV